MGEHQPARRRRARCSRRVVVRPLVGGAGRALPASRRAMFDGNGVVTDRSLQTAACVSGMLGR